MKFDNTSEALGAILAGLVLLALIPFAYIWAWNQLFGSLLMIEYTFWNWLAVMIFPGLFTVRKIK